MDPTPGYTIEDRVTRLEVALPNLASSVAQLVQNQANLQREVYGRPSWAVTMIITLLFGAVSVLGTIVAAMVAMK